MYRTALLLVAFASTAHANPATTAGSAGGSGPGVHPDAPVTPSGPEGPHGIINGHDAAVDDYPMAGALLVDADITTGGMFGAGQRAHIRTMICSSALIAPDVVLLAAHCVDGDVISQQGTVHDISFRWTRQVDLTAFDDPSDPWPADAVAAWDQAVPDEWSMVNMEDFGTSAPKHDIALLFLDEPVTDVPFAYLPRPDEADQVQTGAPVDVVGWGMMKPIGIFDSFLPPEPGSFALKQYGKSEIADVGDYEFQVGAAPEHVRKCKGDSGGPTFLRVATDTDVVTRLVGVTSRSADYSLCETKGGYDTRVDHYLDWIDAEMTARCDDGSRAWCDVPGIIDPSVPGGGGDETIAPDAAVPDDEPEDTGVEEPEDTGLDTDPPDDDTGADDDHDAAEGCGCAASTGAPGWLPVLLGGLLLVRRRR